MHSHFVNSRTLSLQLNQHLKVSEYCCQTLFRQHLIVIAQRNINLIKYPRISLRCSPNHNSVTPGLFKHSLGRFAGRVLTYDYILKELWGPSASSDNQILRVNMANIRRKIEVNPATPEYIFTEVGVGYRMAEPD